MAFVTPRMSLKVWNSTADAYSHEQLQDNFLKLDQHDHSQGRGTPIGGAGIKDGSIEARHIYPGTLGPVLITSELNAAYIPAYVTTLPVTPPDGTEVYYGADVAHSIYWHLRYNSGAATYKWEFLGGPPMTADNASALSPTTTTYADVSTTPTLTLPLGGEYIITFGGRVTSYNNAGYVALKFGSDPVVSADAVFGQGALSTSSVSLTVFKTETLGTETGGVVVKLQYKLGVATGSGGTAVTIGDRFLNITPRRLRVS